MAKARLMALIGSTAATFLLACDAKDGGKSEPPPAATVNQVASPGSAEQPQPEPPAPRSTPTPEPASASQAAMSTPASSSEEPAPSFQPLADAKIGEWAVYRDINSQILRYDIREVGLSRVKTEIRITVNGRLLGMPAIREDLREADPMTWEPPAGANRQTSRTTISAAGRDWNAMLYEDQWTDEGVKYARRTWVSSDAPILGIVRMEMTGDGQFEARLELIEAGAAK